MKIKHLVILAIAGALAVLQPQVQGQTMVDMGSAASFGVLGGASVTNAGNTVINGNIGSSPTATITGFPPGVVNGITVDAATAATAQSDVTSAFNAITGQTPTFADTAAFTTTTLLPNVYNAPVSLSLSGTIALNGNGAANPVFIFKTGSTLLVAASTQILLTNGARAENVFWQVGTSATLGDASVFVGSVLANTSITANTGATVLGGLFARSGTVALNANTVTAVPEPATNALIAALGALGVAYWRRRRV